VTADGPNTNERLFYSGMVASPEQALAVRDLVLRIDTESAPTVAERLAAD